MADVLGRALVSELWTVTSQKHEKLLPRLQMCQITFLRL